jgi:hypothetical protein
MLCTVLARLPHVAALALLASAGIGLTACGGSSPAGSPDVSTPTTATSTTRASAGTPPPKSPVPPLTAPNAAKPSTHTPGASQGAGAPRAAQARFKAALAQLRTCMHSNGAPLPAPGAKRGSLRKPPDTTSPAYKAAIAKCRGALIAALRPKPAGAG